jgi:cold-inducible RNA-binding protein
VKNIFVGNLNSGTTRDAIRSLFAPLGTVCTLKLMTDRDTGESRGFAFVEMTAAEAGPAIAVLDGTVVDGQTIQVREGRPKLHRGAPTQRVAVRPSEARAQAAGCDHAV